MRHLLPQVSILEEKKAGLLNPTVIFPLSIYF